MLKRFLCLVFGHKPTPVIFHAPATDTEPAKAIPGDLQVQVLGQGQNSIAVVWNACGRCDELARNKAREAEVTANVRAHLAAKAKEEKAKREKIEDRKRPDESVKEWKARTGRDKAPKLTPVPPPSPDDQQ